VAPAEQRRALASVLATLKPEALMLPEALLNIIPPRVPDYERGREHFKIRTSPTFDALAPAEAAAEQTLQFLFNPERASRLVEFHAREAKNPSLEEVLDTIMAATWKSTRPTGYAGEASRTVNYVVLYDLMSLAENTQTSPQARAIATLKLEELKTWAMGARVGARDTEDRAHLNFAATQIAQFQKDPKTIPMAAPPLPPNGPPIGDEDEEFLP
jgi:hypothetical protein